MLTNFFSTVVWLAIIASVAGLGAVTVPVDAVRPSGASPIISRDFQAFSIEFAFFVDFTGNKSHPNKFTNNLLANLRAFNGDVPQVIRVGGNTQ